MSVAVHDILALREFQGARVLVAAGAPGGWRNIRRSLVAEAVEDSGQLAGGEFLFVGDSWEGRSGEETGRIVERWDEAGVAAVAMPLGGGHEDPPRSLLAEAGKRSLPLVALPAGACPEALAARVDRAVLADQQARLATIERMGPAFAELTLCACGTRPQEILDRLAEVLDRPLVMFDEFGRAVETRYVAAVSGDDLRRHDHHADTTVGPRIAEPVTGGEERCLWMPLMLRGVPYGSVHVLADDRPFDEVDVVALDRAVAALTTALLLRERDQRLSLLAQRNLVADLVAGRRGNETEFAHRARELGADLAGRRLAVLVVVPMDAEGLADPPEWQVIADCLTAAARDHDGAVLCGGTGQTAVAVLGVRDQERLGAVAGEALARLRRHYPAGAAVATCLTDFHVLAHAFDTATRLANYGAQRSSGVYPVEDYRLELLLQRLHNSMELSHFVRDEIGPLLEHDTRSGQPLLPTLRAYIASRCSKTVTAQRLRVVRRTLYRRLVEIERILGRDLDDGDAVMRVSLALWAWDTLSAR